MARSTAKSVSGQGLEGRYLIHADQPLAAYATPTVAAFAAHGVDDRSQDLVALITDPALPLRIDAIKAIRSLAPSGAMTLMAAGVLPVGAKGQRRYVLFYTQPNGKRLGGPGGAPVKLAEDEIVSKVLPPLVEALAAWHKRGIGHGAVRPDNLYFEDAGSSRVLLGDGLSKPPGLDQPAVYEPVERALASPAGRGAPDPHADMFSLGATVLALYLGAAPDQGREPGAFLRARLSDGSLSALTHGHAVSENIKELCVGLLEDEPANRWTAGDVRRWLDGRPNRAMPGRALLTDRRPLEFRGEEYRDPKVLAQAFCQAPVEGAGPLRSKQVPDWLRHVVKDRHLAEAIVALQSPDNPALGGRLLSDDELVARAAMVMDPAGPIRFRGAGVFPDGIGAALADALRTGEQADIERLTGLIQRGLLVAWLETNRNKVEDFDRARQVAKAIESNLGKDEPGFGVERCLYDLNPEMSCRSPLVADAFVTRLEDLLAALDAAAGGEAAKGDPMDRHLAAFIANRLNVSATTDLADLKPDSVKPQKQRLATLNLLATVHMRSGRPSVPNLAGWLGNRLTVVIEDLRNRTLRKDITDRVKKLVQEGDLSKIARLLNDRKLRKDDTAKFAAAKRDYARIRKRMEDLQSDSAIRREMVADMGIRIATYVAYAILAATIATVAVVFVA